MSAILMVAGWCVFSAEALFECRPLAEKRTDKDLLFLVSFDEWSLRADVSKGAAMPFDMGNVNLLLRGLVGFDGSNAFKPQGLERLEYPAKGNFNPHAGTLVFWTCAFRHNPCDPTTDGVQRGNIYLANLWAKEGDKDLSIGVYEYGENVYAHWENNQEPRKGFYAHAIAKIPRAGVRKGEWHQIAVSWDDERIVTYLNGEKVSARTLPPKARSTLDVMPDESRKSLIGVKATRWDDKNEWDTGIDDFAVYGRVLTDSEIRSRYLALAKGARKRSQRAFDVTLNGVNTRARESLDRLEATFDFAALPKRMQEQLSTTGLEVNWELSGPVARRGKHLFRSSPEAFVIDGIDKPGKYVLTAKAGSVVVKVDLDRPDTSWACNGIGDEPGMPDIWKDDFKIEGRTVKCWNRVYEFGDGPLPEKVFAYGKSILSRRPRLTFDGREPTWRPLETRQDSRGVVYSGRGAVGAVKVAYQTRVEFDGFIKCDWSVAGEPEIEKMELDWQVAQENAQYLMLPELYEGKTLAPSFPYPISGNGAKLIWFAAERKGGFAFTMPNDANWVYGPGADVFFVDRRDGSCRVEMIGKKVRIPEKTHYTALFIATPTRPLAPRLPRYGDYRGGEGSVFMANLTGEAFLNTPFTHAPQATPRFAERISKFHVTNSVSYYGGMKVLTDADAVGNFMRKYWETPGSYTYKTDFLRANADGSVSTNRNCASFDVCPSTDYSDFLLWCEDALWKHPLAWKISYSYFDLCNNTVCRNPLHGCSFKDRFGRRIDSFVILPFRELMRRTVTLAHRNGKTVILHAQRDFHPFVHGLADYWWPGEQHSADVIRNPFCYTDDISDDIWRTEFNRDILGIAISHLPAIGHGVANCRNPENQKYTEAMLAVIGLNDIDTSRFFCNESMSYRFTDIMVSNGTTRAEAVCHKYYEQDEVKSSDPAVRITWWECPNGNRLLFLANTTPRIVSTKVDASALAPAARGREEWTGTDVSIADGRFTIQIPARSFRVVVFGAANETRMWQAKVDAAAAAGGGVVRMGAGRHPVASLFLRSNVALELERGCVLEGLPGISNYADVDVGYAEVREPWQAIVCAVGVSNVVIRGDGTVFGNGRAFPYSTRLGRPRGMLFHKCSNVRLEGVTLRDLASWACYFKACDGVVVRKLTVDSHCNGNNDGIDIDSRNVLVEDCVMDSEDDGIVLKSDDPDFVVENVEVRNCRTRSNCSAIKLGTASHGGFRNILVHDCLCGASERVWRDPRSGRGELVEYRVETWPGSNRKPSLLNGIAIECVDGGRVENVTIRNVEIDRAATPIFIRGGARRVRGYGFEIADLGIPFGKSLVLRDVLIENVKATATSYTASSITGTRSIRPTDITIRNVRIVVPGAGQVGARESAIPVPEKEDAYPESNMFDGRMLPAYGFYVRHADRVKFENVQFAIQGEETRPAVVTDDVSDFVNHNKY